MKKIIFLILFSLILSSSLNAVQSFTLNTLTNRAINITNYEGNFLFTDEEYKNREVLFFFFGKHCPYCIKETPYIIELAKKRVNNLKIIGIHAQNRIDNKTLQEFVQKQKMNFDVLTYQEGMKLVRYLQKRSMWIGGVPFHVIVDRDGNLESVEFETLLKK
jgi:thiol-disulfide isomerase/thioredoxin